jgi:hypothetical protein
MSLSIILKSDKFLPKRRGLSGPDQVGVYCKHVRVVVQGWSGRKDAETDPDSLLEFSRGQVSN